MVGLDIQKGVIKTYIDNYGHGTIVYWLGTVRPHVWALSQINVAGMKTGKRKQTIVSYYITLLSNSVMITNTEYAALV